MSKEKKIHTSNSTNKKSQLSLDFETQGSAKSFKNHSTKVVSINTIAEKQRLNLVRDIIQNTKSF